jgi:hypothetical protein
MTTKAKIGVVIALTTVLASPAFAANHNSHQRSSSAYGAANQDIGSEPFVAPRIVVGDPSDSCGRIGAWEQGYPGTGQCP